METYTDVLDFSHEGTLYRQSSVARHFRCFVVGFLHAISKNYSYVYTTYTCVVAHGRAIYGTTVSILSEIFRKILFRLRVTRATKKHLIFFFFFFFIFVSILRKWGQPLLIFSSIPLYP